MKKIFITLIILFSFVANSQCIKGDCQNGFGTYKYVDEGTFEGVFKNGDAFKGVFTNTIFSEDGNVLTETYEDYSDNTEYIASANRTNLTDPCE